jgi:hypothetical protein
MYARTNENDCIPLISCIGNHEVNYYNKAPYFQKIFQKFYHFIFIGNEDIVIILLDSNHMTSLSHQTKWLRETSHLYTHKICFFCWHVPAYPSYRSELSEPSHSIRMEWIPIIQNIQSFQTIIFQHHDHNYIRKHIDSNDDKKKIYIIGNGNMGMNSRLILNQHFEKSFETNYGLFVFVEKNNDISIKSINLQNRIFDDIKIAFRRETTDF